jgi:(2S)-methylsuccinyl-CoA dehydrogenase
MPRDGQPLDDTPIILPDLLSLTGAAIAPLEALLDTAKSRVAEMVVVEGRVSGDAVEANQTAAHGLAWLALIAAIGAPISGAAATVGLARRPA